MVQWFDTRRWSSGFKSKKLFFLKQFSCMTIACVRELVRTRETGHDMDIQIEICIF